MIVYSANIGNKDRFRDPMVKHEGVEYVYFTDHKDGYASKIWDVRKVPTKFDDPRLDAKWYKLHPHLLFPGEATVWIDSNWIPCRGEPIKTITQGVGLYKSHSPRDCLYQEADLCLHYAARGNPAMVAEDIRRQVKFYRSVGMPEHYGLWRCNVIYRAPDTVQLNEAWWEQINLFSIRDQISMPYVLWKHNIPHETLVQSPPYGFSVDFTKAGKHIQ